jgi:hypothetical protein
MNLIEKLTEITKIINDIRSEDPGMAEILTEGFGLSLNILREMEKIGGRPNIDISEHLEIVSNILGISLKDLVMGVIQSQESTVSDKEVDPATLEFITSDLDDYEKFLAKNKAKESLDFLSKEL